MKRLCNTDDAEITDNIEIIKRPKEDLKTATTVTNKEDPISDVDETEEDKRFVFLISYTIS